MAPYSVLFTHYASQLPPASWLGFTHHIVPTVNCPLSHARLIGFSKFRGAIHINHCNVSTVE